MGVPQFFHWLVTHYPSELLHKIYEGDGSPEILYLDYNCGIHPAVKQPHLKDIEEMFNAVKEYLRLIVNQVKPTKMVYIAIDGVAPNAKMKQQRSRRFKAIQDKREKDVIDRKHKCWEKSEIDFNMISPGTQFMEELSARLTSYINDQWEKDFPGIQVILDDAGCPGEGEHKIMYHLRTQVDPRSKVVIYGLDSDLIFLCLLNYRPGLCLFRERIQFGEQPADKAADARDTRLATEKNKDNQPEKKTIDPPKKDADSFTYLYVGELRKIILSILDPSLTPEEISAWGILQPSDQRIHNDLDLKMDIDEKLSDDELAKIRELDGVEALKKRFLALNLGDTFAKKLIRDYVASTFVLGNDFLPHLPSLKIKEGGLNRVMEAYKEVQQELPSQCLVRDNGMSFNYPFLRRFLEKIARWEEPDLLAHTEASELRISKFKRSFNYRTASPYQKDVREWEYVEDKWKDTLKLGTENWKQRYYLHYFGEWNSQKIRDVCYNYIEGMIWMLRYYQGNGVMIPNQVVQTCASWDWSYHYRNAPSVSCLLANLLPTDLDLEFDVGAPVHPHEQLLVILPPQSHLLLPDQLGRLMTGTESPLIHLYPTDFQIDLVGHRFRWECYPILPDINLDLIRQTLMSLKI